MNTTTDKTPRERGRQTCRAAYMAVISMHHAVNLCELAQRDPFAAASIAQQVVAAADALAELDGLRGDIGLSADTEKVLDYHQERITVLNGALFKAQLEIERLQDERATDVAALEAWREWAAAKIATNPGTVATLSSERLRGEVDKMIEIQSVKIAWLRDRIVRLADEELTARRDEEARR